MNQKESRSLRLKKASQVGINVRTLKDFRYNDNIKLDVKVKSVRFTTQNFFTYVFTLYLKNGRELGIIRIKVSNYKIAKNKFKKLIS